MNLNQRREEIRCKVFLYIFYSFLADKGKFSNEYEISDHCDVRPINFLSMELINLQNEGLIRPVETNNAHRNKYGRSYKITDLGLDVDPLEFFDHSKKILQNEPYLNELFQKVSSIFETDELRLENEDGDLDRWQPLPIDRNSDIFAATVDDIEKLETAVRGDNGYANTFPEERQVVLENIKNGLSILKSGIPTRASMKLFFKSTFDRISDRFQKNAIEDLAKTAWQGVVTLFQGLL